MKRFFPLVMLLVVAMPAQSQVRRRIPNTTEPSAWVSLGIGLFNGNDVSDGNTASTWDFGRASNPLYRAALEKAVSRTASVGLTGTYVRAPFTYIGTSGDNSCGRCAAHLDMMTLGISGHVGGGLGLHQVLEATAGAIQYRNLERDSDHAALAPVNGNIDPYFTFGYGFGYTVNPQTEISIVQDFGLAIHERDGLTSEQSNTLTQRTLRVNLRYGFGNRRTQSRGVHETRRVGTGGRRVEGVHETRRVRKETVIFRGHANSERRFLTLRVSESPLCSAPSWSQPSASQNLPSALRPPES